MLHLLSHQLHIGFLLCITQISPDVDIKYIVNHLKYVQRPKFYCHIRQIK